MTAEARTRLFHRPVPRLADRSPAPSRIGMFGALALRNFRLYFAGQILSNTGSWTQRIAQDWLVLTLTGSTTAVGIATALQFAPTLLLSLYAGSLADRLDKRRVLQCTQAVMGCAALLLATLVLLGQVRVWHVYLIALALGTAVAVDNPTRQSFVNEMVGPALLRNAIGLNSSVIQLGALGGPALAGALITVVGPGWCFLINGVSFAAPIAALGLMRGLPRRTAGVGTARPRIRDGLRYVRGRHHITWPVVLVGVYGFFTMSMPVTLAAYARDVFDAGAAGYATLSAALAAGSLLGALLSARRPPGRLRELAALGTALCGCELVGSLITSDVWFVVALVPLGAATVWFLSTANSTVQMAAPDTLRGRVMGLYLLVFIGSGAVGGPVVGALDERAGPRAGLLVAGLVPLAATVAVAARLAILRHHARPAFDEAAP